jgi:hypothetical protein
MDCPRQVPVGVNHGRVTVSRLSYDGLAALTVIALAAWSAAEAFAAPDTLHVNIAQMEVVGQLD